MLQLQTTVPNNFIYHSGPPVFAPSLVQFCKLRHMHDNTKQVNQGATQF